MTKMSQANALQERRRFGRFLSQRPVRLLDAGSWIATTTVNLSQGGMLVASTGSVKSGQRTRFQVHILEGVDPIDLEGLVRSIGDDGVRVQFIKNRRRAAVQIRRVISETVIPALERNVATDPADVDGVIALSGWYREIGQMSNSLGIYRHTVQQGHATLRLFESVSGWLLDAAGSAEAPAAVHAQLKQVLADSRAVGSSPLLDHIRAELLRLSAVRRVRTAGPIPAAAARPSAPPDAETAAQASASAETAELEIPDARGARPLLDIAEPVGERPGTAAVETVPPTGSRAAVRGRNVAIAGLCVAALALGVVGLMASGDEAPTNATAPPTTETEPPPAVAVADVPAEADVEDWEPPLGSRAEVELIEDWEPELLARPVKSAQPAEAAKPVKTAKTAKTAKTTRRAGKKKRRAPGSPSASKTITSTASAEDGGSPTGGAAAAAPAPAPAAAPESAARAYIRSGMKHLRANKPLLALHDLEKATAADPNSADAYLALGLANAQLGRRRGAVAAYQRFLTLAPDHPKAAKVRQVLAAGG